MSLARITRVKAALDADLQAGRAGEDQVQALIREMENLIRLQWPTLSWYARLHCLYQVLSVGGSVGRCIPYMESPHRSPR